MKHDLEAVSARFRTEGSFLEGALYGTGHINDTYAVWFDTAAGRRRMILQRVNHNVFKDVPRLMENIQRVTAHIGTKISALGGTPDRETLTLIPTTDGAGFLREADGNHWRMYMFIEGARTYDEVTDLDQVREAARAFGRFQTHLLDLPGPRLHETIPGFHHTPKRFAALEAALAADPRNRAARARPEIEFALARKAMTGVLIRKLDQGELQERVTHNDTKINNVMLDDATGRGVCVIDLDTVMPGLVLYDFGDQVRTTTCTGAEDDQDLAAVRFEPDRFEALVQGYLDTAREFLLPAEIDALAFSGKLITFEIGIRFLADYLDGDVYFKTHRPDHNLHRARVQFERVRHMEAALATMEATVARFR